MRAIFKIQMPNLHHGDVNQGGESEAIVGVEATRKGVKYRMALSLIFKRF